MVASRLRARPGLRRPGSAHGDPPRAQEPAEARRRRERRVGDEAAVPTARSTTSAESGGDSVAGERREPAGAVVSESK